MTLDKKAVAARQAAAKYSYNVISATTEYAKLTGQFYPELTKEKLNLLQDEMLSLLEPYRQPMGDKLSEYMCFVDPDGIEWSFEGHTDPVFIVKLKDAGISGDLLAEIKEYSKSFELQKTVLAKCQEELNNLRTIIADAQKAYNDNSDMRSSRRNTLVVQALGISKGVVPKRIDQKQLYMDYLELVRRKGMSRKEAVKKVQEEYGLNSYDAALKMLQKYRSAVLKKWEQMYPSSLPDVRSRLKGFLPSRR